MGEDTPGSLYVIADGSILKKPGPLIESLEKASEAVGDALGFIQLRGEAEQCSDEELTALIAALRLFSPARGTKIIVNRRTQVAARAGADGVHLPGDAFDALAGAREQFSALRPSQKPPVIGYSAHTVEEVSAACRNGASYVFLSPIFPPLSKKYDRTPLGVSVLESIPAECKDKVYALGGITAENANLCRKAGVRGIACISAVLASGDPAVAAKRLLDSWNRR